MLRHVLDALDLLADPRSDGAAAVAWLAERGATRATHERLTSDAGHTDVVRVRLGPDAGPMLGILGVLGGTGLRPERPGLVSDADGAAVALAVAAGLARWEATGDALPGPVLVSTHLCPRALSRPGHPAPMMTCPVPRERVLAAQLDPAMRGVLSVDATKANRLLNRRGVAITPAAREGWLLRVSDDLLAILEAVTGEPASVLPVVPQDVTPYASGVRHINAILQPATLTAAPVVGVAVTAASVVAGSATGANDAHVLDGAARFCAEVARGFAAGRAALHDEEEYDRLVALYGSMARLQGAGTA